MLRLGFLFNLLSSSFLQRWGGVLLVAKTTKRRKIHCFGHFPQTRKKYDMRDWNESGKRCKSEKKTRRKWLEKKRREKESRLSSGHRENLLNPIQIGLTSCFYASTLPYHLLLLRMTLIWNNDVSSRVFCHTHSHTLARTLHMMHGYKSKYTPWLPSRLSSISVISNIHQVFSLPEKMLFFTLRHIIHKYTSAKTSVETGFLSFGRYELFRHNVSESAEHSHRPFVSVASGKWLKWTAHTRTTATHNPVTIN